MHGSVGCDDVSGFHDEAFPKQKWCSMSDGGGL
jgi:hypothetical protein